MPGTRKLGRTTDIRKSMLRGMVTFLLENGKLDTTVTRAKEVRSLADKMITLGKKDTLASRRQALAFVTKESVVTKLFTEIASDNAGRNGGYTAVYRLGPRRGDGAEMARIVLISAQEKAEAEKKKAEKKPRRSRKAAAETVTETKTEETAASVAEKVEEQAAAVEEAVVKETEETVAAAPADSAD